MKRQFKKHLLKIMFTALVGVGVLAGCEVGTTDPSDLTVTAPPIATQTPSGGEPTSTPEATQEPSETPSGTVEPGETPSGTVEPTATGEAEETPTAEPTVPTDPTETPTMEATVEPTATPTVGEPTMEPTEEPTEVPTEEPTEIPDGTPTVEPTPDGEVTGTPTPEVDGLLQIGQNSELGEYLTDDSGYTLYALDTDSENSTTCYDACTTIWVPLALVNEEEPTAGSGLDETVDSFERDDGFTQVSYAGMPLYYSVLDAIPGETNGHGMMEERGTWHAVAPDGTLIEAEEPTETPTAGPTEEPSETPTVEPTEEPSETPTAEPTEEPSGTPTAEPTEEPSTGFVDINVDDNDSLGAEVLTDADGYTLYVLDADGTDESTCTGNCTSAWPPLLLDEFEQLVAGGGVDASLLNTFERDDGTAQVSYNGMALYGYAGDAQPGDATGHGVEDDYGIWSAISPEGEAVDSEEEETPADGPVVEAMTNEELVADILADEDGMTLYVLSSDTENASTCNSSDCIDAWPPFLVDEGEAPVAGDNVDGDLLDTLEREDGTIQASYNGMPLYYYENDFFSGEVFGHGIEDGWGEWSAIAPSGDPIP